MSRLTKLAAAEIMGLAEDKQALENRKLELEEMDTRLYSPRGATLDAVPTRGGGNRHEEKIVKIIDDPRRDELQRDIKRLSARIKSIEATLERLSELERRIIKAYYMGGDRSVANLMASTNYSEAHLIRKKLDALRKYARMRGLDLQKIC